MRLIALLALIAAAVTAHAEDFKTWAARQPNPNDWVALRDAATARPVTGYTYTTNVVTVARPTAFIEQQLAAMIVRAGKLIRPTAKIQDVLAIVQMPIEQQYDIITAERAKPENASLEAQLRITRGTDYIDKLAILCLRYGIDFADPLLLQPTQDVVTTERVVTYGKSPSEVNGWGIVDMGDVKRLMK